MTRTLLRLRALAVAALVLPACDDDSEPLTYIDGAVSADMATVDGAAEPDAAPDMAVEADMAVEPDLAAEPDMAGEVDMAAEADMAVEADMAAEPDMTPDMAAEPDMAVDEMAPAVEIISPRMNDALPTYALTIAGTATDDTALATVTVALGDGEPTLVDLDGDGTFVVDARPAPGLNTVRVVAEDAAGNQSEATVDVWFGSRGAAGGLHTGFVIDGTIWSWGRHNRGQVGAGADLEDIIPTPIALPEPVDAASLVYITNSSIALTADGGVWTWGDNGDSQLGLGDPDAPEGAELDSAHRFVPERVPMIDDAVAVGRGFGHGLVLRADGTVLAFGENDNGQLGDGTTETVDHPVAVVGLDDVVKVVGGSQHTVALRRDGTVWAWGRNQYGNLGQGIADDEPHPEPAPVPTLADVVDIASGRDHVLALTAAGAVYAWGLNRSGQLGIGLSGDEADRSAPTLIDGIDDGARVFAGGNMSFVLRADGTLWGFGQNFNGQLGTGDTTELVAPQTPVVGLEDIVDVGAGATHVTGMTRDGTPYVWGWNARGSLGDPDLLDNWAFPEPIEMELR